MADLDQQLERSARCVQETVERALCQAADAGVDAAVQEFNRRVEGGWLHVDVEVRVRLSWSLHQR